MIKTVSIIVVLVLVLLAGENALACKCGNPPGVGQSFDESAAVFYGTVESVEGDDKEMVAVFKVEKSWKGANSEQVMVKTDTTSCGIDFKTGEKYYLFVDRNGSMPNVFKVVPCRRHAGAQEEFLKDKPVLLLKANSFSPYGGFSGNPILTNAIIVTVVIILLAVVLFTGLYFFKSRKPDGLKKE